jgi:hypothetical protein
MKSSNTMWKYLKTNWMISENGKVLAIAKFKNTYTYGNPRYTWSYWQVFPPKKLLKASSQENELLSGWYSELILERAKAKYKAQAEKVMELINDSGTSEGRAGSEGKVRGFLSFFNQAIRNFKGHISRWSGRKDSKGLLEQEAERSE